MQDHDNSSNKNNNIKKMPGGERRQVSKSNGQSRPMEASRSSGQPRRQAPDGQPRPRRQAPDGQSRPGGQMSKASGQPRPNGQSRTAKAPGDNDQPRRQAAGSRPRPAGQAKRSGRPEPGGRKAQNAPNNKKRKNVKTLTPQQSAKKKRRKILLFVTEIFLLLILVAALWTAKKAQNITYVEIDPSEVHINKDVQAVIEQGTSSMKGYRNIALFGVDSRNKQLDKNTRTDVIMIASINQDTKEVKLVSVYRDTWLNMTNDSYSKANAAYNRGGAAQAIGMLNMNLDLDITEFVTVGFDAVIDVVDAIGGVEIDVKEDEIAHLNSYQISMSGKLLFVDENGGEAYDAVAGVDYIPVEHAGLQTLNGLQATAYCRIRYTSGGDGARTERQRRVLTEIAKKAMTMNPATLNKIADSVFGEISTSLTLSEILSLLSDIASYEIGDTAGFPFNDHVKMNGFVGSASVVVPIDLTKNVSLLHEFLFDESDYTPSETVKQCSEHIASDTGVRYNGE
ncbi:MAG: LCP family protein [Lachnospiraceae bacterium]|nr:LCP family protein [Lachnospiraceae bacterium]